MKRFSYRTIALALVCMVVATLFMFRSRNRTRPTLPISQAAVESQIGKTAFFNQTAAPLVRKADPSMAERMGASIARFDAATQDPLVFRQLDRKLRFDTIVLAGDPAMEAQLLGHLVQTKDWTLTYLDDLVLIFKRPAQKAWTPADLEPLEKKYASLPKTARAEALAGIANRLQAVRKPEVAREQAEAALAIDGDCAAAWNELARYHASISAWKPALEAVDRAILADRNLLAATATKVEILSAMAEFYRAYPLSKKLWRAAPDDPHVLFLHAKVAHAVKAYSEEIEALKHLIDLAVKAGHPDSGYQLYLGQAYAATGEGELAVSAFESALRSGDLSESQQEFAQEAIDRINPQIGRGTSSAR